MIFSGIKAKERRGEIRCFAPSYRRGGEKASTQRLFPFVRLVVARGEARRYKAAGNDVVTCPDKAQGNLCRVRNWILEENQDARCIVIMDDDYQGFYRWELEDANDPGGGFTSRASSSAELEEFIEMATVMAEDLGARFWGVNLALDKGIYREYTPFSTVAYIGGPFQAFRPGPLRYDEALPLKEDYDMTLQQLREYRMVLRFNAYFYVVDQHGKAGGCAVYRNIEREKEQFEELKKKWGGGIVRTDCGASKTHRKQDPAYDINPVIRSPIHGV